MRSKLNRTDENSRLGNVYLVVKHIKGQNMAPLWKYNEQNEVGGEET